MCCNTSALGLTGPRLSRLCAPGLGRLSDQLTRRTHAQRLGCPQLTVEIWRLCQLCSRFDAYSESRVLKPRFPAPPERPLCD
jgi:hypothetical protein